MDNFTDYVKAIIYFVLLSKLLQTLAPSGHMTKIFKLITGILLILLLINPILSINKMDNQYLKEIFKTQFTLDYQAINEYSKKNEDVNEQMIKKLYIQKINKQIELIVADEGGRLINTEIEIIDVANDPEYGKITAITIQMTVQKSVDNENEQEKLLIKEKEIMMQKSVKSILKDFYNLEADNINISIVAQ